jgi:hypothetical protein
LLKLGRISAVLIGIICHGTVADGNVSPLAAVGRAMARFHFHLRTGADLDRNDLGIEYASLRIAWEEAVLAARSMTADAALAGELPLSQRFEIADAGGQHLLSVPFSEALRLS